MVSPRMHLLFACLVATGAHANGTRAAESKGAEPNRRHHYVVVHRLLPSIFFSHPGKFTAALRERKVEFLKTIWADVGEERFPGAALPPDGLDVTPHDAADGTTMVVLSFPKPVEPAEAYFAALVELPDGSQRYYTLEKTIDLLGTGGEVTILCEWTADGAHRNFGGGSAPEVPAFIKAVMKQMAVPRPPAAAMRVPREGKSRESERKP